MENTILNKYWKEFHNDKIKDYKEVIKKMDFVEKILYGIVLLSAFIAFTFNILIAVGRIKSLIGVIVLFFFMLIEFLGIIISNKYTTELRIQRTYQEIKNIRARFTDIHEWLKTMGFSKKAEIEQLTYRCVELYEEWENEKKESRDTIEKIMTLFYSPVLLAIVSWILSCNVGTNDIGTGIFWALLLTTIGLIIYWIINFASNIAERMNYSQIKKMKYMIKDFKGVLDYCFDSEDQQIEILN